MKKNDGTTNILLFGLGVATGWLVKQLFDSPEVTSKRQELQQSLEDFKQQVTSSDEAQRVKHIFGQVTDEATQLYQEAQDQLFRHLARLQVSLSQIDRQKYFDIVTEIIEDLREDDRISSEQLQKLGETLKEDFAKLRKTPGSRSNRPLPRRSRTKGRTV